MPVHCQRQRQIIRRLITMYQQFTQPAPIIFGCGSLSVLGEKLKERGLKKALCVFDKGIANAGITEKAFKILNAAGVACVPFDGVAADPPVDIVDKAGQLGRAEGVDCVIGIGGGSSMDAAKAASILLDMPGTARDYVHAAPIYYDTKTPLFLVPTTSGTGSECTLVAIITIPEINIKGSVFMNTTLAIVDPELTVTLPKYETVNTGLDAFAHAAEAMTSSTGNRYSDLFGEAAIKKISDNLRAAYNEPNNLKARSEMALAANWAGLAFNNPLTHAGHAAADAFSCSFHTPHGLGCALALPEALALVAPVVPDKMRAIALAMGLTLSGGESGAELGSLVADGIRKMMRDMDMKSLREMGYSREKVISLAPDVAASHLCTHCPVEVDLSIAKKLLADIYDTYL